jgi:hypothetical protein
MTADPMNRMMEERVAAEESISGVVIYMASSVLRSVTSLRRTQNIGQTASQKNAFRNAFRSL